MLVRGTGVKNHWSRWNIRQSVSRWLRFDLCPQAYHELRQRHSDTNVLSGNYDISHRRLMSHMSLSIGRIPVLKYTSSFLRYSGIDRSVSLKSISLIPSGWQISSTRFVHAVNVVKYRLILVQPAASGYRRRRFLLLYKNGFSMSWTNALALASPESSNSMLLQSWTNDIARPSFFNTHRNILL